MVVLLLVLVVITVVVVVVVVVDDISENLLLHDTPRWFDEGVLDGLFSEAFFLKRGMDL